MHVCATRTRGLLTGALWLVLLGGCNGSPASDAREPVASGSALPEVSEEIAAATAESTEEQEGAQEQVTAEEEAAAAEVPAVLSGISVRLSLGSAESSGRALRFALTNDTAGLVHVYRDQTPLDGLTSQLFDVTRDGEPAQYLGIEGSRLPADPTSAPERFVALGPGESLTAEVDLADYYDLSAPGAYEVRFAKAASAVVWELDQVSADGSSYPVFDANEPIAFIESSGVQLRGSRAAEDSALEPDGELGAEAASPQCSRRATVILGTVRTMARQRAWNSYHYLDDHAHPWNWTKRNTRYTYWYGYNLDHRHNSYDDALLKHWWYVARSLNGGFSNATPARFRCEPSTEKYCKTAIAYVWGDDTTKTIHLCPSFWHAGESMQRNTLLHEMSHFTWPGIEGARDIRYFGDECASNGGLPRHDRYYNADDFKCFAIDTRRR
jgi:peptidyl-Lys metalloendopeptidase